MSLLLVSDLAGALHPQSHCLILLVPGLGPSSPPVKEWGVDTNDWQDLSGFTSRPVLRIINHGVESSEGFKYQNLLDAGNRLCDEILSIYDEHGKEVPMIFIAHSLGGSILKHALLCLGFGAQNDESYARILRRIAGVVFISSPHGVSDPAKLQKHMDFLLKKCASSALNSRTIARINAEFDKLVNIHERFSKMGLHFDMLSSYENEPSSLKRFLQLAPKKLKIMDAALTKIHDEPNVALQGDHFTCCKLADIQGRPKSFLVAKLRRMIEQADQAEEDRSQIHSPVMQQNRMSSSKTEAFTQAMQEAFSDSSPGVNATGIPAQASSQSFSNEMDTIFVKLTPKRLTIRLPCFMIKPGFSDSSTFIGREDVLSAIDQMLLPDHTTAPPSADPTRLSFAVLHGMPGVGKTEIASHFVFTRKKHFDAIFWVCASSESKLEADFCRIAAELGVQENEDQSNPFITKNKVKSWLAKPIKTLNDSDGHETTEEAKWLLVFDDADQPEILREYLQIHGRGSILITSRDPSTNELCSSTSTRCISAGLEPFTPEEACMLLSRLTRALPDQKAAFRIANHHLGGLPLAIAQVASVINNDLMSYQDMSQSLDDPQERLNIYRAQDIEDDLVRNSRGDIASIWAIQRLGPEAKLVAQIISLLFPDSISTSLLQGCFEEESVIPVSGSSINSAPQVLASQGLIRFNVEAEEIWMHKIPRYVIRANMADEERLQSFLCAIKLVQAGWPEASIQNRHNKHTVPERKRLLPHVVSLADFYEHEWRQSDAQADISMAALLYEASWFMYERGSLTRARPIAELGLKIFERNQNIPRSSDLHNRWIFIAASLHDTLGCIANGTNTPVASKEHNSESLKLRQQLFESQGRQALYPPLAYAHNQMGCSWMMARKFEEGKREYEKSLQLWSLGGEKGLASMEYANLGMCHWLLGNIREASDVLEKGLKEREDRFGRDNPESFRPGRILHALGNVRASQLRFDESEAYHRRALRLYLKAVGSEYHRVADICHKLAQHALRHNTITSLNKALGLVDRALEIWGADSQAFIPEIARTSFLKSKTLFRLTRHDPENISAAEEATHFFGEAVEMYAKLVPGSSKRPGMLSEDDFDREVMFWSR